MFNKKKIPAFLVAFKDAALRLYRNNPLRLGSATAFFSIFAIPPIIIILSYCLRILSEQYPEKIYSQIEEMIGSSTAATLKIIIENLTASDRGIFYTIGSVILFLFIATNLFRIVQQCMNDLYEVQEKKKMLINELIERAIGFAFILITGLLFVVALLADTLLVFIGDHLIQHIGFSKVFMQIANIIASLLFAFIWSVVVLRLLPALRIHWKAISVASFITAVLIITGKYAVNLAMINVRIKNVYEASASIVLLFIFIFYGSLIIYYGASYAISFALAYNLKTEPKGYAEVKNVK